MNPTNTQNPNNPNQYNPQTGNLVLNSSPTGIGNQPPVIPAGVGLGSVQAPTLPNTPQGTGASSLSGASAGYLAMPALNSVQSIGNQLSNANQVATQNANQGAVDYTTQFTNLLNQMQNRPGELEQQYGIQKLSADALGAKANYDSVELAYRRQKEATMTDGALSADQKQARIGEIERKEASQKADIAIDYNLKSGLLSNAKELMQKQLALELEPLKMKADFYKDNRDRFDKILDKTEMRQYDFIQKKEERAYEEQKALKQAEIDLKMSAAGILSPEKQKQFISDSTAKQAASRVGVINAINEYYKKVEQYKGKGGVLDLNRLTKTEKADLKTALNTTIGSAINVAQGQGAMGNEEAERIMGQLDPSRWTRTKVFESAARGITDSQATLLRSNLDFLETYYPGVKNMTMFSDFMSDDEFFNNASTAPSTVDVTTYFGGVEL